MTKSYFIIRLFVVLFLYNTLIYSSYNTIYEYEESNRNTLRSDIIKREKASKVDQLIKSIKKYNKDINSYILLEGKIPTNDNMILNIPSLGNISSNITFGVDNIKKKITFSNIYSGSLPLDSYVYNYFKDNLSYIYNLNNNTISQDINITTLLSLETISFLDLISNINENITISATNPFNNTNSNILYWWKSIGSDDIIVYENRSNNIKVIPTLNRYKYISLAPKFNTSKAYIFKIGNVNNINKIIYINGEWKRID